MCSLSNAPRDSVPSRVSLSAAVRQLVKGESRQVWSVSQSISVSQSTPASQSVSQGSAERGSSDAHPKPEAHPLAPPRPTPLPTHPTGRTPTPHGHPLRSEVCVLAYDLPKTSMLFHNIVPI